MSLKGTEKNKKLISSPTLETKKFMVMVTEEERGGVLDLDLCSGWSYPSTSESTG